MSDAEPTPSPEAVEIVARAIEEEICRPYEWSPELFEIWWTRDPRNKNHGQRRKQATTALKALEAAGFTITPPGIEACPGSATPTKNAP